MGEQRRGITRRVFIGGGVGAGVVLWWHGRAPSDRPQLAFVGLGAAGRQHLAAAVAMGFEVVALIDADAARTSRSAAWVAKQRGRRPQIHRELCGLLDDPAVDAVVVATPTASHLPLARAVLDRRKHVLVETPWLFGTHEGRTLAVAAERAGRLLIPAANPLTPCLPRLRLAYARAARPTSARLTFEAPVGWSTRELAFARHDGIELVVLAVGTGVLAAVEPLTTSLRAASGEGRVLLGSPSSDLLLDVAHARRMPGRSRSLVVDVCWRGPARTARESFAVERQAEVPQGAEDDRFAASMATLLSGIHGAPAGPDRLSTLLLTGEVLTALRSGTARPRSRRRADEHAGARPTAGVRT